MKLLRYTFAPMFSPAAVLGFCAASDAFELSQWWIAIPLVIAWVLACRHVSDALAVRGRG